MTKQRKFVYVGLGGLIIISIFSLGVWRIKTRPHQEVTTKTPIIYAALGDSVAAGDGLESPADSSACNRTVQAYPNILASTNNLKLVANYACSGASIQAGILGAQTVNSLALPAQMAALKQLKTQPDVITITVGANDIGWTGYLTQCYISQCGTTAQTAAFTKSVAEMQKNLSTVLAEIASHYPKPPRVIVVGYYRIFPANNPNTCTELIAIDATEKTWVAARLADLNNGLQLAATTQPFSGFVAADFTGHEVCTPQPWVQNLQARAPFHPTDAGQQAIADAIISSQQLN